MWKRSKDRSGRSSRTHHGERERIEHADPVKRKRKVTHALRSVKATVGQNNRQ